MESNPLAGILGLLMMLQLGVVLLVLLGGLYALYCLNRAASGLDRLASAMENWVAQTTKMQAQQVAQNTPLPGQSLRTPPTPSSTPSPSTSPTPLSTYPAPTENLDWIKPIELPDTIAASKPSPEVVTTKPPQILPVTPPFGNQFGPESEANRE